MAYQYFSHNGNLLPIEQATIPLSDVEYSYGFGVYETIRVSKGRPLFVAEHAQRLLESARIIGLEHQLSAENLQKSIDDLIEKNAADTCNLKALLIGGKTAETTNLYMLCLNPLFPDRKLYSAGAQAITQHYERPFPHAKTLNMLPSYLAYRQAKQAGAYDALLVNRDGNLIEGTRTNFFTIKDKTIYSPPGTEILLGVTRSHVLDVARQHGFAVVEQDIPLSRLDYYDGAFLTSTGSKILPLRSIDEYQLVIPDGLHELMAAFDKFLAEN